MAKFRKKPVEIEAWPVFDLYKCLKNWKTLPQCVRDAYESGDVIFGNNEIHIRTLEGLMTGGFSDWIIKGIKGELYPCKPDVFAATYDRVYDGDLT